MSKEHELKTDPEVFQAVSDGNKNFEIRLNDREFKVGDWLILKETTYPGVDMKSGAPLSYTGRRLVRRVKYILHGPIYGLSEGWVLMSFDPPESELDKIMRICALDEAERDSCDECGANIINDCSTCGAPQCCPQCCKIDEQQREIARLKIERDEALHSSQSWELMHAKARAEWGALAAKLLWTEGERQFLSRKLANIQRDHETISASPVPNAVPGAPDPRQSDIAPETGQSSGDEPNNEIAT